MNDTIIFKNRNILVSEKLFRTPRRSYRISDIEKLSLKRPFLFACMPLAVGSYYLIQQYAPYLYELERYLCFAMFTLAPILSWFIGTLSITSKSYSNDDAITGYMPTLKNAREAIESVIFSTREAPDRIELLEDNQ